MANFRIEVRATSQKGRGVFAKCLIKRGQTIEIAPVIVLTQREASCFARSHRRLQSYCYNWGDRGKQTAFVMGCGPFFNHSYNPNSDLVELTRRKAMRFFALRDIRPGEEITHNYNGSPKDQTPIRFRKNYWERMPA